MNETELENMCLDWFKECGWNIIHGQDIAPDSTNPERKDYRDVLLQSVLEDTIVRLNPHLPYECIEQVISTLQKPESLDLASNNRTFHRYLIEGVPVQYKKTDKIQHDQAFLIDFERPDNNKYQAINQFTITGIRNPFHDP